MSGYLPYSVSDMLKNALEYFGHNHTIKEMVEQTIEDREAQGLFNHDNDCGCFLPDLAPCGGICNDCIIAYITVPEYEREVPYDVNYLLDGTQPDKAYTESEATAFVQGVRYAYNPSREDRNKYAEGTTEYNEYFKGQKAAHTWMTEINTETETNTPIDEGAK